MIYETTGGAPSSAPTTTDPSSADTASAAARPHRLQRVLVGLALVTVVGGAGWFFLRGQGPDGKAATTKPDVPTVDGKTIVFSAAFRERAGVSLETVIAAPLMPQLRVVGTVDFDPAHVATVGARIPGMVRKLNKVEGDRVERGEVLAEIDSAELGEAQANLAVAKAQSAAAETNERRERELMGRGLTTAREQEVATATNVAQRALVDAAEQRVAAMTGGTMAPLGTLLLKAPLAGTVVERHVHAGQSVDAQYVAFRVANLDRLWVDLSVFESSLDAIRQGDDVELTRIGAPDEPIPGKIAYVGEVVDPVNRTAEVRIAVDNQARKLRPGQSVTATIRASGPARKMLSVPASAITYVDGKPTVFRVEGPDRVIATPVVLGPEDGKRQGVLEGLTEGQSVVSQGVFALKSELFR